MNIEARTPVTSVAAAMPAARALFEAMGIDYSCAGERTIREAAHAQGIEPALLLANLRALEPGKGEPWSEKPLVTLTQHLASEHHHLVRDELAKMSMQLADLCTPSVSNTEMRELRAAIGRFSQRLIAHMHEEEETLFPQIEALERAWQSAEPHPRHARELRDAVLETMAAHAEMSNALAEIRELRLRAGVSAATPACRDILALVQRLEAHVHEYMFLENCFLMPRALAMAEQLLADNPLP